MSDSSDNDSGDFWDWFDNKPQSKKRRSQKHYHPIFLLIILTLLSAGLVGGGYYFLIQPPVSIISSRSQEKSQKTASPSALLVPSSIPAVTSTVDITILNGSGIRGQAAKTSTLIESLGYEDISVDNADKDTVDTIAQFSKDISKLKRTEIIKKLETVYQNVISKDLTSDQNKIMITTGDLKVK